MTTDPSPPHTSDSSLFFIPLKTRLQSLVLSATLLVLLPLGALAEGAFSVFSPKTGLADGWKTSAWSGLVANETEGFDKGTTSLQIMIKGDAQPYAGAILAANPGSGVPITDTFRKTGMVILNLKPGKNIQGDMPTAPQPLQVALSFLTKDGETVHGSFNVQTLVAATETGARVSVPMITAIKGLKAPELLASVSAVRLQYVGAPVAGFYIVDCTIKAE